MKKRTEKYLSLLLAAVLAFGLVSPCLSLNAAAEDITAEATGVAEQAPAEETEDSVLETETAEPEEETPAEETEEVEADEQTPAAVSEDAEEEIPAEAEEMGEPMAAAEEESDIMTVDAEAPADPAIGNTTDELFQFHCTTEGMNHEDQTYNFFGTHVSYKKGSMQYDEARGVYTATLTVNSISTLLSTGVGCPDKVWGHSHYCQDENGKTITSTEIQVVWDPDASGQNSAYNETTGLWLPDGAQTVNVFCETAPVAPTTAKISSAISNGASKVLWIRNYQKTSEYQNVTKLAEGTFEVSEITGDATNGFYITVTITDLDYYLKQFNKAKKKTYVLDDEHNANTTYTYTLKYNQNSGTVIDYTKGSWSLDKTNLVGTEKNNGKTLYVIPGCTVTFEAVANGKVFDTISQDVAIGAATPTFNTEYKGYTYNGWVNEPAETATEDVTYVASYTANKYLVSFDTNGGNYSIGKILKATYDEAYGTLLAAGTVDGYTNDGWYVMNEDGTLGDEEITAETLLSIADDHVLFQKRSIAEPEVELELSEEADSALTYEEGKTFTMTANTTEYSTLAYAYQWYKDGVAIEGATSKELTVDVTVANSGVYKVEVTAAQKGRAADVIPSNSSATGAAEYDLEVNPAENTLTLVYNPSLEDGFVLAEDGIIALDDGVNMTWAGHTATTTWTTNEDGTGDSYTTGDTYTFGANGGENVTLYLQWTVNQYTVTFEANGTTVSTITKAYGDKLTAEDYPAVPAVEGYTGAWKEYTDEITGDVTVQAVYTEIVEDSKNPENPAAPGNGDNTNPENPAAPGNGENNANGSTNGATNGTTTNAATNNTTSAESAKTGDSANLVLWMSLAGISVFALVLLMVAMNKKRYVGKRVK
jgi:hypothetical protein